MWSYEYPLTNYPSWSLRLDKKESEHNLYLSPRQINHMHYNNLIKFNKNNRLVIKLTIFY